MFVQICAEYSISICSSFKKQPTVGGIIIAVIDKMDALSDKLIKLMKREIPENICDGEINEMLQSKIVYKLPNVCVHTAAEL